MSTLRVDTLVNRVGNGAPNFANGLTAPSAVFTGNVSIGGTLSYEDVQNIDSIGIVTARQGIKVTTGGIEVSSGVVTATSFDGSLAASNLTGALPAIDGSQLTGISSPVGGASGIQFDTNVSLTFGDVSSSDKLYLSNTGNSIEIRNNQFRGIIEVDNNNFLAKYDDGSSNHWRMYTTSSGIEVKGVVTVSGSPGSQGLGAADYPEFKINGSPVVGFIGSNFGLDGNTNQYKTADYTLHAFVDKGCAVRCNSGCTKVVLPNYNTGNARDGTSIVTGSVFTIFNQTGGDITLEQTSPLQIKIAGDNTGGNKTLANMGLATIWYYGESTALVTGNVS